MDCAPLNAWPVILVALAVGAILGALVGARRERRRWIGRRRVEL